MSTRTPERESLAHRLAPTLVAAAFALGYVIVSPPSLDLAAHELRAKLFSSEGFGLWNNWWYAGHHTPGYSVLFPPLAALLTPQIVGAVSAVGTAALFDVLARDRFGRQAFVGSLWFASATATQLLTGRLTFAFGLLPAMGTALALERRRDGVAALLAVITALASPVAAIFAALAAAAAAVARVSDHDRRGTIGALAVAAAALIPVGLLAVLFPEGGSEPFAFATLWPIPLIGVIALFALPRKDVALRAGVVLYVIGCLIAYEITSPVGSNASRLAALIAGPLAAMLWWRRRTVLLLVVLLPLLYLQWQPPVRDVSTAYGQPWVTNGYYQPLISFLERQPGQPFRIEIPFTLFHWEAYQVAPRFPIARGWERQLDIKYNHIFYDGTLSAATYEQWLHENGIRYVAVSSAKLDYSAHREVALIAGGLPYLKLVMRSAHWRVYEVQNASTLAAGPATVTNLGPNSVTLHVSRPGSILLRVHFTPYWELENVPGCVAPAGDFTRVSAHRAGTARLVIAFSLGRIGARAPRCN